MVVYVCQLLLIGLTGIIIKPAESYGNKRRFLFIAFLILVTVSGFRAFSVGADTWNYVRMFNNINTGTIENRIENGFRFYLKMLRFCSDDPRLLLIVSSCICIGATCLFILKLSRTPVVSVMLYVLMGAYFTQMNTMRQSLALAFTEIAFTLLLCDKKRTGNITIAAALLIIIAKSFHTIAMIAFVPFVLLLLLRKRDPQQSTRFSAETILLYSSAAAVAGFVAYPVIIKVAGLILPGYVGYLTHSQWSDSNYNASLFNTLIVLVFVVTGGLTFKKRKLSNNQVFAAIMIGFALIFNVLSMRMEIWGRVAGLFSIYTYLLWAPEFISDIESYENRFIIQNAILIFGFAYMIIVLVFRPEWTLVVPYYFGSHM